jgi:hypothetical protein
MSNVAYEQRLQKAVEKFITACNELAQLAYTERLEEEHVTYTQNLIAERVKLLKKQLEFKHPEFNFELPKKTRAISKTTSVF